jgi:imidazoleglycerol phosphate dehydratase HisB
MAAHPSITLGNLSGVWVLNRELSDPTDTMLKLQGISKTMRQVLNYASMTLHIEQYTGEDPH